MPTLMLLPRGASDWTWFLDTTTPGEILLQLSSSRQSTPAVRRGKVNTSRNRVEWDTKLRARHVNNAYLEYELMNGYADAVFQITTYADAQGTPGGVHYIWITRNGDFYDIRRLESRAAADLAVAGHSPHPENIQWVGSADGRRSNWAENRRVAAPGPFDRFSRILDFGVQGVDPEPPIEEVLDQVAAPPPARKVIRKEIPEDELLKALEGVTMPREHEMDQETRDLLALLETAEPPPPPPRRKVEEDPWADLMSVVDDL